MSDGTDSRFARAAAGLVAALATAVLVACGGGGSATADAQYSASYAVGRISGFGSIVVNGVHYDETTAAVTDDDDDSPDDDSLELGMVVEVEASDYGSRDGRNSAKAESITLRSQMRGPVESVGTESLGLATDLQPPSAVLLTQAQGESHVQEAIFEDRLEWLAELGRMGARVTVDDPHHATVSGPSRLHGAEVSIGDLRAGASLILAALAADGTTLIHGAHHVHRGYENIEGKFLDLGARIERLAEGSPVTSS